MEKTIITIESEYRRAVITLEQENGELRLNGDFGKEGINEGDPSLHANVCGLIITAIKEA